jgi:hypothetical protein
MDLFELAKDQVKYWGFNKEPKTFGVLLSVKF